MKPSWLPRPTKNSLNLGMGCRTIFGLKELGVGQQGALLTSASLVSLMFLPAIFWYHDNQTLYNK